MIKWKDVYDYLSDLSMIPVSVVGVKFNQNGELEKVHPYQDKGSYIMIAQKKRKFIMTWSIHTGEISV